MEGSIGQVDLAPTLALLLGLPIPQDNTGVLITRALEPVWSPEQWRRGLRANAKQLFRMLNANPTVDHSRLAALEEKWRELEGG